MLSVVDKPFMLSVVILNVIMQCVLAQEFTNVSNKLVCLSPANFSSLDTLNSLPKIILFCA
jgi:hypothetical protein